MNLFAGDLSAGTLAGELIETESSDDDTVSDLEEKLSERQAYTKQEHCLALFRAAIILRGKLKDVSSLQCQWPPTADDFTDEAVAKAVPPEVFNFLC